jgi:hypothetical protein
VRVAQKIVKEKRLATGYIQSKGLCWKQQQTAKVQHRAQAMYGHIVLLRKYGLTQFFIGFPSHVFMNMVDDGGEGYLCSQSLGAWMERWKTD